ncbi:MAG: tRNA (N(6)-L-threonylcarbamoyladenosine(37)-C(2))-methylthiotransferase [Nanoarchaeota archaeon]|nr:tRNA (N(6)-L-threonylcarbamoyladenosine(37)-C(2))-methylthiotransferase [Nanoarchaeota archaeon]
MTKIHIETYGCAANIADSEQMAGLLKKAEFKIVDNVDDADVVIINTCTVKGPTEDRFWTRLKELQETYKILIIAGCIAQTEQKKLKAFPLIGTNQIHKVVEVVEEALNENIVKEIACDKVPDLNLPIIRKNPIIEIIPISRGCLGACTYCKTKHARGNLRSYPVEDIVKRAEKAVDENVREIWLTSQDCGCYGFDIDTNLPTLLNELIKIKGKFKIRVGMMNPEHLEKIQDQLIDVYQSKKIFKFLHLPVQSGDNEVLENMKRLYKVQLFKDQINAFRAAFPEINIMTDIIVGFPGETSTQNWNTMTLVREIAPDSINISRFWARPNTPAAKMKNNIPGEVIKHRSNVLTDIFHNISRLQNERWTGWEGPIIIDEKGKNECEFIGRNESYKQIIVVGDFKLGDVVPVKVVKFDTFALFGKVIKTEPKIIISED